MRVKGGLFRSPEFWLRVGAIALVVALLPWRQLVGCRGQAGMAWTRQHSPLPAGYLRGVWGRSIDDIYAVGTGGAILHYDGRVWESMDSGTTRNLTAVWGRGDESVFVVGEQGALLVHDGRAWTDLGSELSITWHDVGGWTEGALWAVGETTDAALGSRAVMWRYENGAWSEVSCDRFALSRFTAVWATSGRDVLVAGEGTGGSAWVLRYDGDKCTRSAVLDDVALGLWGRSVHDVYAVGQNGMISHYDGIAWSAMDSGVRDTLHGVWGGADRIYCAGARGQVLAYDGAGWQPVGGETAVPLYGLWGDAEGGLWAVGGEGGLWHGVPVDGVIDATSGRGSGSIAPSRGRERACSLDPRRGG